MPARNPTSDPAVLPPDVILGPPTVEVMCAIGEYCPPAPLYTWDYTAAGQGKAAYVVQFEAN